MKTLKIIFYLLFSSVLTAQNSENFSIENSKVIWEHVYSANISQEEIKEILSKDAILSPIATNFTGTTNPVDPNCQESQAIFMYGQLQYFATIDFKEGKYRVTVSGIQIIPSNTISLYGVESTTNPSAYESFIIKNSRDDFRGNNMAQNSLNCLNNYFLTTFEFKETLKEDW